MMLQNQWNNFLQNPLELLLVLKIIPFLEIFIQIWDLRK